MNFTTRKGRPPQKKYSETAREQRFLTNKKLAHSMEVLDFLHKKSLITEQEQWAGAHLRWLYILRFGAPDVSAIDLGRIKGKTLQLNDPIWQEAREKDYNRAIMELRTIKAHKPILNIAVFNQTPKFIMAVDSFKKEKRAVQNHADFRLVVSGLGLLCNIWGRQNER